jgi:hypothetical protein
MTRLQFVQYVYVTCAFTPVYHVPQRTNASFSLDLGYNGPLPASLLSKLTDISLHSSPLPHPLRTPPLPHPPLLRTLHRQSPRIQHRLVRTRVPVRSLVSLAFLGMYHMNVSRGTGTSAVLFQLYPALIYGRRTFDLRILVR